MIFLFLKKKYFSFLLASFCLVCSVGFSGNIHAQTPTPTPSPTPVPFPNTAAPIFIKEALGFNNIASDNAGDYFILFRYELSIGTSPDQHWCQLAFLVNNSGCSLNPPNPDFPFSLKEGYVYAEYLDSSGQMHIQNTKVPRIYKGVMGMYSEAPASSQFGFNTNLLPGEVCLKYNQNKFTGGQYQQNCMQVNNITGGAVALAEQIAGSRGILYNLENDLGLPLNTLVSSAGLITPIGQKYMEEALQGVGVIAVDNAGNSVFELGTVNSNSAYTPVGSSIGLNDKLATPIASTGVGNNLEIISNEYLGFASGGLAATVIFTIFGIMVGAGIIIATGNPVFALMGTMMMMLPAMFIGGISVGFLFTVISLGTVFGSWYWIRRSPE